MKIVITAGGGGHFAPALAVIRSLKNDDILVIGRKYTFEGDSALSLEYQTLVSLKIPFRTINTGRLQRKVTSRTVPSLLKMPGGFIQAFSILRSFEPDKVVSFGGYISVPVVLAAYFLRIPVVIHEQTFGAGLANKITAPFAEKICISWEASRRYFPKGKTILTGNPIKKVSKSLYHLPFDQRDNALPLLFITGGSGGSHTINLLAHGSIGMLLKEFRIIHQTGDAQVFKDFDSLAQEKLLLDPVLQRRYFITKFVEPAEIIEIMKAADLVISRAGVNTMTELLEVGTPALLIPLPHGQNNEQSTNAHFFESIGLGKVVSQYKLTPEKFIKEIHDMLRNISVYKKNSAKGKDLVHEDSTSKIVEIIKYAGKKNN